MYDIAKGDMLELGDSYANLLARFSLCILVFFFLFCFFFFKQLTANSTLAIVSQFQCVSSSTHCEIFFDDVIACADVEIVTAF